MGFAAYFLGASALTDMDCNCTPSAIPVHHKHSPADSSLAFGWIHSMTYIKGGHAIPSILFFSTSVEPGRLCKQYL